MREGERKIVPESFQAPPEGNSAYPHLLPSVATCYFLFTGISAPNMPNGRVPTLCLSVSEAQTILDILIVTLVISKLLEDFS